MINLTIKILQKMSQTDDFSKRIIYRIIAVFPPQYNGLYFPWAGISLWSSLSFQNWNEFPIFNLDSISSVDFNQCAFTASNSRSPPLMKQIGANMSGFLNCWKLNFDFKLFYVYYTVCAIHACCKVTKCEIWILMVFVMRQVILRQWCV